MNRWIGREKQTIVHSFQPHKSSLGTVKKFKGLTMSSQICGVISQEKNRKSHIVSRRKLGPKGRQSKADTNFWSLGLLSYLMENRLIKCYSLGHLCGNKGYLHVPDGNTNCVVGVWVTVFHV